MIEPFGRPVRSFLEQVVSRAHRSLLIVAPFIRAKEADWLVGLVRAKPEPPALRTLTSISAQSVAKGTLQITALQTLSRSLPGSEVINLPRLHAKVYVADSDMAVVTSANLTPSGMDGNYEYGVAIDSRDLVSRILSDMEGYARLGNPISAGDLQKLGDLSPELQAAYRRAASATEGPLARRFQDLLQGMRRPVLEAQVGRRSANTIFSQAILFALRNGPLATREMHPKIQQLLPDLCDDREELIINGQRFGKRWKHDVRNAQQSLKQAGVIKLRQNRWTLVEQLGEHGQ
jgi:hypothetical protein